MTEKRFTFVRDDNNKSIGILDNKYERKISEWGRIARLLNELSDENEQLKDALNQRTDQCDKYYKENEQLKSFIKGTCIFCGANLRQQYIEKYGDIE